VVKSISNGDDIRHLKGFWQDGEISKNSGHVHLVSYTCSHCEYYWMVVSEAFLSCRLSTYSTRVCHLSLEARTHSVKNNVINISTPCMSHSDTWRKRDFEWTYGRRIGWMWIG
jgi:hypothetical protein